MSRPVRPESASKPRRRRSAHTEPVSGPRAKLAVQTELLGRAAQALNRIGQRSLAQGPAIRYLESSRSLPRPVHAPLPPADQIKLLETQADRIVEAVRAVLDGLGLSREDWERGRKLAAEALRAVAEEGWSPL